MSTYTQIAYQSCI